MGRGLRWKGLLVVGLSLLSLAGGDALAWTELGGLGDDRLAGLGVEDGIWGPRGAAASVDHEDRVSPACEAVYPAGSPRDPAASFGPLLAGIRPSLNQEEPLRVPRGSACPEAPGKSL